MRKVKRGIKQVEHRKTLVQRWKDLLLSHTKMIFKTDRLEDLESHFKYNYDAVPNNCYKN